MSVIPSPSRSLKLVNEKPKISDGCKFCLKFPSVEEIFWESFTVPSEFKNRM